MYFYDHNNVLRSILGDYEIYISKDAKRIGKLCRSLSITQDIVSPHTYRFCCNYDMVGEMLTVMKTDKGSLRLFEIETQGMVSKSEVLTNNNFEKKPIQLNSIIS